MNAATSSITGAAIQQWAKHLRLPTWAGECARMAEQATKEQWNYLSYLEAEVDERDRHVIERRLKEACFPKVKTLEEFDFQMAAHLPAARLRKLAEGDYGSVASPAVDCTQRP